MLACLHSWKILPPYSFFFFFETVLPILRIQVVLDRKHGNCPGDALFRWRICIPASLCDLEDFRGSCWAGFYLKVCLKWKEKSVSAFLLLISYFWFQTPALNLLWEKCCSENVAVRTACSEGLVALVAENHAELEYILHGALNLIPSAR